MANPERSTELLWGAKARVGLNLERIVRTAIELADAEGLSAVSMRRVAERLGFTTMSLYRHVPGKAELVDLMRDEVMGEPAREDAGNEEVRREPGWRGAVTAWARAELALCLRHPWLVESTRVRSLPGPNAVAGLDWALGVVAETGLPPRQVVAVVTLVSGFIESAARQAVEALRMEQSTGVGEEEWWGERDSLFEHMHRYPTLTRIYSEGGYHDPLDPFEFGLQRVLDGIEVLIGEGRSARDGTRDESGDESRCTVCGKATGLPPTGRPRKYCSRACRQRAYRQRNA
ncbi:regulatory protein, tetR family [Sinosporangium album]|uniref:Regulatory protein, tetR family n=1 Tax=Sinosporangium album TaxID=504805 RepID=A0A1G8BHF2_9ACTN|nr:TetR/AcrR family transcriptional regulator [Sinosporangium album]SDH32453.1 regulatory protein, tetR family [Sinosporangium album]